MRPKMNARSRTAVSLSFAAVLCLWLSGQTFTLHAQLTNSPGQASPPRELRFPVAYLHGGAWCYGFLYGSDDKVRFEVVQPESAKSFSFEAPRSEVMIRQWVLLGTPQDAIEIKTGGKTYHMRWLANPDEILNGGANRWTAPAPLPPYALITAMQNPSAALAQIGRQAAPPAVSESSPSGFPPGPATDASPAGGIAPAGEASPQPGGPMAAAEDSPQDMPPGMLAGVYISTVDSNLRPRNSQYIFYPDGIVMNGLPEEGMLDFDFNHYRMQNNREGNWVGRYRMEGDMIQIAWLNQRANPTIILRNETVAQSPPSTGPSVYFPSCRCTGKQLSGVYHWNAGSADQYIQFFPNGTFIDHHVLDQLIAPSRFFDHPRIRNGRYQIARQTIIFALSDGQRATRTFLAPKVEQGEPKFDWISLGRQMFFEQGYDLGIRQGR